MSDSPAPPRSRRVFFVARIVLLLILLMAMAFWAMQWARTAFLYVHETDARIMADLVSISSEVDGRLLSRAVEEGDRVTKGQTLAVIDSRAAILKLRETEAERATVHAELARVEAESRMIGKQIESRILAEQSKLAETEANRSVYVHELTFAEKDFHRIEKLARSGAVSTSRFDRSRTDYFKARQELLKAETEIATARAQLDQAVADRARLMVKRAERTELEAGLAEIEARIESQGNDIADRTIVSPMDGVVGRAFAKSGEYVSEGQRLLVLHDSKKIWVETNIRETEIGRLAIGQPVRIEVDAYPDLRFEGTISRIGNAATSQFALLPSLNEAGTFTKVTQRIQVRVALEQQRDLLKPGMMVEIFIDAGAAGELGSWLR